jgi:hypothetical protein
MRKFNHSLPKNRNPKKEKKNLKGEKESKQMKKLQKPIIIRK